MRGAGAWRMRVSLLLPATALLVACGGGSSSGPDYGGPATHDSPDGAVRGFVGSLSAWDGTSAGLDAVEAWVDPTQRNDFRSGFSAAIGSGGGTLRITIKVAAFTVTGVDRGDDSHATVHITGDGSTCVNGTVNGQSVSSCSSTPLTPNGSAQAFLAVRVNGQWFVDASQPGQGSFTGGTDTAGGAPPATTSTGT